MFTSILLASILTLGGTVHTANGRGVKGVPVSNGDTIVITDKNGRYSLPVIDDMSVFPILDGKWKVLSKSQVGNSAFPYIDSISINSNDINFLI